MFSLLGDIWNAVTTTVHVLAEICKIIDAVYPNQIVDAIKKAIQVIEEIISELESLESDMEAYETKKNLAKGVGTAINVVGGGLAVASAFATGGTSLLVGSAISTAVGTTTNLITDFVDRDETKECMKKIENLLAKFDDAMKSLNNLITKFNKQVETTMKANSVSYSTAFYMALGMPSPNPSAMGVTFMMTTSKLLTIEISAITFTASEMKMLSNLFGITAETSAKTGAAGIGTSIGTTIGQGFAVVGVVLTAYEVVNLIKTSIADHPTITTIKNVKRRLRTTKSELTKNCDEFQAMQKNAKEAVKKSFMKTLDDEFGGGYSENGNELEPLAYELFVKQIGMGSKGGFFEIHYLTLMTGRQIEIIDGTEEGEISMLHGNSKLTFLPISDSNLPPIRLLMSSLNGTNHFNLLGEDDSIVEITTHSMYENRCLYDAVARALNISTDDLLNRFRKFLQGYKAAKDAYENGIDDIFSELRGGAKEIEIDPEKQLKLEKTERIEKRDSQGNIYYERTVITTVRVENLHQGSVATCHIRKNIQKIAKKGYDAGHLIGRNLGGAGDDLDNFEPQTIRLNRGEFRCVEQLIIDIISEPSTLICYAELSVSVRYRPDSEIPYEFVYKAAFYNAKGKLKKKLCHSFKNI